MRYRFRHGPGFTLLELIVVLFIIALATAVVTASLYRGEREAGLKKTVRGVYAAMRQARDEALLERRPVTFNIDEENGTYRIGPGGRTVSIPEKMSIKGEPIVFFPKGNSTGGAVFIVHEDYREYSVIVDEVTGLARIEGL